MENAENTGIKLELDAEESRGVIVVDTFRYCTRRWLRTPAFFGLRAAWRALWRDQSVGPLCWFRRRAYNARV
jgi:hypothetical protein